MDFETGDIMPEIRQLGLDELKEIYVIYMEDDFPRAELRPFSSIKKNYEEGNYNGFGFYEGDRLLAYACYYSYPGSKEALMDYFAVVPELRGKGVGSAFLRMMASQLPEGDRILIEAESADTAKNEADRIERERRLSFYERNGAILTGVRCLLFTVDYEILVIGAGGQADDGETAAQRLSPEDYMGMIHRVYMNLYKPIFGRLCRLYIKDDQKDTRTDQ